MFRFAAREQQWFWWGVYFRCSCILSDAAIAVTEVNARNIGEPHEVREALV